MRRLLAVGDALAVMLALTVALVIPDPPAGGTRGFCGASSRFPLIMVLFKLYGLYDRDVKRISYSTVDDLPWLFHATVIGSLIVWLYARYSPMQQTRLRRDPAVRREGDRAGDAAPASPSGRWRAG